MKFVALISLVLQIIVQVQSQCNTIYQRKEIRQLSSSELTDFFQAVRTLNSGQQPSRYAGFVNTHIRYAPANHGTANFLVWHRIFLRNFELALQAINPKVSLPYWNWSYDSQAPELSGVLSNNYFGGQGSGNNNCVTTGQFANWTCHYDYNLNVNPHCLARKYNGNSNTIAAFYSPEAIQSLLKDSKTYDQLRQQIEYAPHGSVHNGIGGDMQTMASTNDPLFWLHHAFIDKIYYDWQTMNPNLKNTVNGNNQNNQQVRANDILQPFNVPVSNAFDINNLCYNYVQDGVDVTKPPTVDPTPTNSTSSTMPSNTSSSTTSNLSNSGSSTKSTGTSSVTKPTGSSSSTKPSGSSSTNTYHSTPTYGNTLPIPSYIPIKYGQININITIGNNLPQYPNIPIIAPPSSDRQDAYKLRIPQPLPDSWIRMNRYPISYVREQENKLAKIISTYNQIGFRSPACLAKRPDLASHLNIKLPVISIPILKPLPHAHPNYKPGNNYPTNSIIPTGITSTTSCGETKTKTKTKSLKSKKHYKSRHVYPTKGYHY